MDKYEEKIVNDLVSDREHAIMNLQGLGNYQLTMQKENNQTGALFANALGFAALVLRANGDKATMPVESKENVTRYLELLECLYYFSDRMYPNRKNGPLLMFLSHEDYVRALDMAVKEIRQLYPG